MWLEMFDSVTEEKGGNYINEFKNKENIYELLSNP